MTHRHAAARVFPRRRALGALGVALGAATAPTTARAALPGSATLLVPGPEDGALHRFAQRLLAALGRGAGAAVALHAEVLGGADGVTAANRFATAANPDGRALLVLPGAACQARLSGNPRARFDPAGWLPVCAALAPPLVLAGRAPLQAAAGTTPLRIAAGSGPGHPFAGALLGLDLLRIAALPVFGPAEAAGPAQGQVDAMVVQVPPAELTAHLAAQGLTPWFVLDAGTAGREAAPPDVPSLSDRLGPGGAALPLAAAARAVAAAARLQAALVLPALTPADLVALWRAAVQRGEDLPPSRSGAAPVAEGGASARLVPGTETAPLLAAAMPPAEAIAAYRAWLAQRLGWRPD